MQARIPYELFDDLESGKISTNMFLIMSWLYRRADWTTGIADMVSAKKVLAEMWPDDPSSAQARPSLRTVQRVIETLADCHYISSGYVPHSQRTYAVTIHNFSFYDGAEEVLLSPMVTLDYRELTDSADAELTLSCRRAVAEVAHTLPTLPSLTTLPTKPTCSDVDVASSFVSFQKAYSRPRLSDSVPDSSAKPDSAKLSPLETAHSLAALRAEGAAPPNCVSPPRALQWAEPCGDYSVEMIRAGVEYWGSGWAKKSAKGWYLDQFSKPSCLGRLKFIEKMFSDIPVIPAVVRARDRYLKNLEEGMVEPEFDAFDVPSSPAERAARAELRWSKASSEDDDDDDDNIFKLEDDDDDDPAEEASPPLWLPCLYGGSSTA